MVTAYSLENQAFDSLKGPIGMSSFFAWEACDMSVKGQKLDSPRLTASLGTGSHHFSSQIVVSLCFLSDNT